MEVEAGPSVDQRLAALSERHGPLIPLTAAMDERRAVDIRDGLLRQDPAGALPTDPKIAELTASLPVGIWAIDALSIDRLVELVRAKRPSTVVEFGSGTSTVVLASLLAERHKDGPRLVSFEQDPGWAEHTRAALAERGLDRVATVIQLEVGERSDGPPGYLMTAEADELLSRLAPQLILVDGPTLDSGASRLGALDLVAPHLRTDAMVLLDDARRRAVRRGGMGAPRGRRDPRHPTHTQGTAGGHVVCTASATSRAGAFPTQGRGGVPQLRQREARLCRWGRRLSACPGGHGPPATRTGPLNSARAVSKIEEEAHGLNICTIIARNYVAFARVLAESFKAAHPDGKCTVLVIDDPTGFIDPGEEPFELLRINEIGIPDPERMAAWYDVMELSTAVKPWLLRTLLERPDYDHIVYLDPDIRIFAPLEEIENRVAEHDVVLTPHFDKPLPRDGRKPAEEDILIAGTYNLGFIALRAGKVAEELLDWWSERLESHCLNEPEIGRFVDQRWIDLVPGIWSDVDVLRDPSYNIAYWNLATRSLEDDAAGAYRVDGRMLRFFHFSGFDPRRPKELSKHQNRIRVADQPPLRRICGEYAEELLGHGYKEAIGWPYGWDSLPNGIKLDREARRMYREMVEAGGAGESVFEDAGAERFAAYLKVSGDGHAGPRLGPHPRRGVNLVGYLSDPRGVGEAARLLGAALGTAEVPLAEVDVPADPKALGGALGRLGYEDYPYDFNLICINADMLPLTAKGLGPGFFEGRHSAGLWFWEVSHFPEEQRHAFDNVDEVWVASEHVADALRPLTSKPVNTIRVPLLPGKPGRASRAELGMPEGFCFLFVFDYRSVFRRKNPLGLVEAFSKAFAPGEGPSLVIKSIGSEDYPAERRKLAEAADGRPDIRLIDDTISKEMKDGMIAACDCYVSLHRSEGLGLTMAEAMCFGKPVIATAYSGNLDFMTAENSYLVPHAMVEIGPDAAPYPADKQWAEPDLERAAELMRQVFENPEAAGARGKRAAEDIRRTHSLEAAAETIQRRISQIKRRDLLQRLEGPTPAQAASGRLSGRAQLVHLINFPVAPNPQGKRAKARAFAKRAYMRLLRPYAAHQQAINVSVAESLDDLREVLAETVRMANDHEERLSRADALVAAAAAEPFMSDDRLGERTHPLLGRTIGFRSSPGKMDRNGYRGFEDLFRGSEEMIRDRQRVYLDLIDIREPVLDAGCGRGEFLDLLAERGIPSRGVDLDAEMVRRCREKGHESVEQASLLDALERTRAGSLGAIFSAQVIEHLELGELRRFLELGRSRLRPGGLLIAETVNPHSAAALKAFWVDPTHKHPLFPEAMLSLCALAGYAEGDVFAPLGSGDWETDRTRVGEYAIVAANPA